MAQETISTIKFELIGGAMIFVPAKIVSVLSEPNLIVMQGTQIIFASSCILPLSVITAQAFEINQIVALWFAIADQ
ncbi:MAG: hypothetical protein LBU14_06145 [Candidatus Peribacteria bacterium]|jgi:hypothetical protein|nr:hypothetical protein [Candidatus Peribacteria bacterium]